ncbi:MAG: nucleotidyltransferase domain-containing protein [Myxococcota bacterium]
MERIAHALSGCEEVVAAYVFGSRVVGRARRDSDVDVAVVFRAELDDDRRFALRCALSERVARAAGAARADVVDLERAPPLLAREVIARGHLLFSRDEPRRVRVVARQTMRYVDTRPLRRVQDEAVFRRLREGTFGRLA